MKRKKLTRYLLAVLPLFPFSVPAQVDFKQVQNDHIAISIGGSPFSDFYIGSAYPKPFLAPLRTAKGLIVTRQFPMVNVPGESRDHPHHRGLWIGFVNVNGINFWENEFTYKTKNRGKIILAHLGEIQPGKKSGSISATFDWQDPNGNVILEENRKMTFYDDRILRIIDVDATLTAKQQAHFADDKDGFFAIRVADSMAEKNGGIITASTGQQTEKNVWGKRADWADYDGAVEGQKVGIAIFDNPANYNHPPRWHARAYGLFAVNPFGLRAFDKTATQEGGYTLNAGQSLRFRYRVIIHPGDVPMKKIEKWYVDYKNGHK